MALGFVYIWVVVLHTLVAAAPRFSLPFVSASRSTCGVCYCLSEQVLSVLNSLPGTGRWVGELSGEEKTEEDKEVERRLR